jgi:AcrR family transcriptional regulator
VSTTGARSARISDPMKAKSAVLASRRQPAERKPAGRKRRATTRMPAEERREQIQAKAFEFFSEYGLTAQTRALADACGVSQRLLYSAFPNKAALINAVYQAEIAGPFKAIWIEQLRDRSVPLKHRLTAFYREYYDVILTRRWLRLFLYASLAEVEMASTYISAIIRTLLLTIVEEAAQDANRQVPPDPALAQEIGWVLHGAISHLAIRRNVYADGSPTDVGKVITLHVTAFLAAIPHLLVE